MLKKVVNIVLFLFVVSSFYAQNYESYFGTSETHVIQINNNYTLGMYPYAIDSLSITNTVSTSDNLLLKEVEYFRYYDPDNAIGTYYLREDTSSGKLWIRASIDGNEYLVADMTLEIGDTTNIFSPYTTSTVSDVSYINGKKHIFFNSNYPNGFPGVVYSSDNLFFKEGVIPFMVWEVIGMDTGGYFAELWGESAPVCITKDGVETFSIDSYWTINTVPFQYEEWVFCHMVDLYYNPISTSSFVKANVSISPNPVQSQFKIVSQNLRINQIDIFDVLGKKVKSIHPKEELVNVEDLKKGLYFVVMYSDSGRQTQKMYKL
jgi:hypothetical protein